MTPEEILAQLIGGRKRIPELALEAADGESEALVEPLLRCIERCLENPAYDEESDDQRLFGFALLLLGKWREPRLYPLLIRWLSLPEEDAEGLGGDMVTEDGSRLLAAVCGEDLEPIKALILNREAYEFGRGQAVEALAILAARGEAPREAVEEYFRGLAREGLEREPNFVWGDLAVVCADLGMTSVFPELRRAYEEELIDPFCMQPKELDDVEKDPGDALSFFIERNPPITDVAREVSWWSCFAEPRRDRSPKPSERGTIIYDPMANRTEGDDAWSSVPQPYKAPGKVGRNEPCPCGSGKKYKRCCGSGR